MPLPTADELVARYAAQIQGKVILTTGVSPGSLGAYFVQALAKARPALLILAGRDEKKAQETAAAIATSRPSGGDTQTRYVHLDLESLQSVREAAAVVNSWSDVPVIDVLVNNAGISTDAYTLTVDGVERTLAANHLGHFLFTNLIMEKILASSAPRVASVSSSGHRLSPIRFGDYNFDDGKTFSGLRAYGQSKTANMLFAISLAEKLRKRGLLAFSLHPGTILTNAAAKLDLAKFMDELRAVDCWYGHEEGFNNSLPEILPVEQGAATHVYAAFDPNLSAHNGAYLLDCRVADPFRDSVKPWATDSFQAEKLWRLSEELVGQRFSY